jgi:hypothetical protein
MARRKIRLYVPSTLAANVPDPELRSGLYAICRGLDRWRHRADWEVVRFSDSDGSPLCDLDPRQGRAVVDLACSQVVLIGDNGRPVDETDDDREFAQWKREALAAVGKTWNAVVVDIDGEPTDCYPAGPHFWIHLAPDRRTKWLATHRASRLTANLRRPGSRTLAAVLAFALESLPGIDWSDGEPFSGADPDSVALAQKMTEATTPREIFDLLRPRADR